MLSQYTCVYLSKTTGSLYVIDCCHEDSGRVLHTTTELREVNDKYQAHKRGIAWLNKKLEGLDVKKYGQIGHC